MHRTGFQVSPSLGPPNAWENLQPQLLATPTSRLDSRSTQRGFATPNPAFWPGNHHTQQTGQPKVGPTNFATSHTPAAHQQHQQYLQPSQLFAQQRQQSQSPMQPNQQNTSTQTAPLETLDSKVNSLFEEAQSLHSNHLLENARRLLYIHALFLDTPLAGSKLHTIWTSNDQLLWQGYDRIVLSDHGLYLESFTQPANVSVGRVTSSGHFQSLWTDSNQRIYYQIRSVDDRQNPPGSGPFITRNNRPVGHPYADYKAGAHYVSLFDVKICNKKGDLIFDGPAIKKHAATLWGFLNGNAQPRSGSQRSRKASRSAPVSQRSHDPSTTNFLSQPHVSPTPNILFQHRPQNRSVEHDNPTTTMHSPARPAHLRITAPDNENQPRMISQKPIRRKRAIAGNVDEHQRRKKPKKSRWGAQRTRHLVGFSN
jgi:hypothetical protein